MKKILIMTLLISHQAFAAFPLVKFSNLQGEFADQRGTAYAESAKYDIDKVKIAHKEIEVQFNKKEKHLVIRDPNTTVELGFDFSFLNVFRSLNFTGANLDSTTKKFGIAIDELNVFVAPSAYELNELLVTTDLTQVDDPNSDDTTVLDGFVLNGALAIKSLHIGKINQDEFIDLIVKENPDRKDEIVKLFPRNKMIPIVARNLKLKVDKGIIDGRVLLDSWINANLYIGAELKNLPKQNKLQINLTRAKLGYFSIKKVILNSIRKLNIDTIHVNGQVITVDLGKVVARSSGKN